ncbi:MAG: hypothetical protein QXO98_00825 [Sulfolobales archaeon]
MKPLESIAKTFVSEVSLGKTIDWYLIKLSSILTYLKDSYGRENISKALEEFLNIDIVSKALEPLACHIDTVATKIDKDPRFSDLRPYTDLLINALSKLTCRDLGLSVSVREPTFKIEEKTEEEPHRIRVIKEKRFLGIKLGKPVRRTLIDVAIVVSAASVIAYIVYLIIHQRGGLSFIT